MTTLHDFGGVLRQPLDIFFWALTISCHGSWLMWEVVHSQHFSSIEFNRITNASLKRGFYVHIPLLNLLIL